jgi:hypothetical protein
MIKILEHLIHILCVDYLMVLDDLDLNIQGEFLKDPDIILLGKYIQIPVHFTEYTFPVFAGLPSNLFERRGMKYPFL